MPAWGLIVPPRARVELDELLGERGVLRRVLLELDAGVEVLGVLADEDDVDVLVLRADAVVALAGAYAGVEVQGLPKSDVDAPEAGAHRGRDRALDADLGLPDRLDHGVRQRRPGRLHDVDAGLLDVPLEAHPGRVEDALRGVGDLGAGAVAGDEGDAVCHGSDSFNGRSLTSGRRRAAANRESISDGTPPAVALRGSAQGPPEGDEDHRDHDHQDRQGQPEPGIVAEAVAADPVDHRVRLVADRRQERRSTRRSRPRSRTAADRAPPARPSSARSGTSGPPRRCS